MSYCPECGAKTDGQIFCSTCGTRLTDDTRSTYKTSTTSYIEPQGRNYDYPKPTYQYEKDKNSIQKTTQLQIVIILQWIGVVLLGFATLITLIVFFPIGIIVGLFFWLQLWIVRGLNAFNNSARIVLLVLTGIGLFSSLIGIFTGNGFDIIGIFVSSFIIYTLAFHKPTVDLFIKYSSISRAPSYRPNYS